MSKTWNKLESLCNVWASHRGALAVPYTECGDYVGGIEYRSNARVILEDFDVGRLGLVRQYFGAFNSTWLTVGRSDVVDALRVAATGTARREIVEALRDLVEAIESLEEYAILNDADCSELILEALSEYVDDWLRWDAPEVVREMGDEERAELADKLLGSEMVLGRIVQEYNRAYVRHEDMAEALGNIAGTLTA